jgi:hypothetical protein
LAPCGIISPFKRVPPVTSNDAIISQLNMSQSLRFMTIKDDETQNIVNDELWIELLIQNLTFIFTFE